MFCTEDKTNPIWIEPERDDDGIYKWSNGVVLPTSYINPKNNRDCVLMRLNSDLLHTQYCYKEFMFVCKAEYLN